MSFITRRDDRLQALLACKQMKYWGSGVFRRGYCIVCQKACTELAYVSLHYHVMARINSGMAYMPWDTTPAGSDEWPQRWVGYEFDMSRSKQLETASSFTHHFSLHHERELPTVLLSGYTEKARSVRCFLHNETCKEKLSEWKSTADRLKATGCTSNTHLFAQRLFEIETSRLFTFCWPIIPIDLFHLKNSGVQCWHCERWLRHTDKHTAYLRKRKDKEFVKLTALKNIRMTFTETCEPSTRLELVGVCYVRCDDCPLGKYDPARPMSDVMRLHKNFYDEIDSWTTVDSKKSHSLPAKLCTTMPAIRDKLIFCYNLLQ